MPHIPQEVLVTLHKLDDIERQVFVKLEEILNIKLSENVSVEIARSQITKDATKLIINFQELLAILKIQSSNYPGNEELSVMTQIYESKISLLKQELRENQLKSYKLEEELIHEQRIEKFAKVPERKKSIGEMKQELFNGRLVEEEKKIQEHDLEDKILDQNKSITATLQSTRHLMTSSIMQTELNMDSLDQQSKDLSTFDGLLSNLEETLKKSRNIVKFIEKQDRLDKNRIYLSLGFFLICCLWVIWRRILKTPVKILLWSFFKIFKIFLWLLPKSKEVKIIEAIVETSSATLESIATDIATASSSTSSILDTAVEVVMDIEASTIQTWEQTVTELIKDEL